MARRSPAAYRNVIAVAAPDDRDTVAYFSNIGPTSVHPGAPGVGIVSTVPATGTVCCTSCSGYLALDGPSMAALHVSGAAALLFAGFPASRTRR